MAEVKVTTKTRRAAGAKREAKPTVETARIAVVGIPASGKTTYFRFLSGHFGLNLPILYIPARADGGTGIHDAPAVGKASGRQPTVPQSCDKATARRLRAPLVVAGRSESTRTTR